LRAAALLALIVLLGAVEAALPRVLGAGTARPLLAAAVVFFLSLRWSTIEGAELSLAAGFVHDVAGGGGPGPGAFIGVAAFVGARLALAGLHAEGRIFEAAFTFAVALLWNVLAAAASSLFGPARTPLADSPWLSAALWSAAATAAASPLVMAAARRVEALRRERPPGALQ